MQGHLDAYLAAQAARPFAWGRDDCAGFVLGWLGRCGVMLDRDGFPADPRAFARMGRARFIAACRAQMVSAGLAETVDPLPGDPVLVEQPGGVTCGLALRAGVALKAAPRGVIAAPLPIIAAWRLPEPL